MEATRAKQGQISGLIADQRRRWLRNGCMARSTMGRLAALYSVSNPYATDFHAVVTMVDGPQVTLHQSAFHAFGAVELSDYGLIADREVRGVTATPRRNDPFSAEVQHQLADGADMSAFPHRRLVEGAIDWHRRHRLMRLTTAVHLLAIAADREQGLKNPEMAQHGDIGLVVTYQGASKTTEHAAICQALFEIIADDLEVAQSKSPADPTEFYCHIDGIGFSPTEHPMLRSTAEIGDLLLDSAETELGVAFSLAIPA